MTNADLFQHAVRSLLRHRLRTLLSAGCIAIGIASVMTMLAVGLGAREKLAELMGHVGATRIDVAAGADSMGGFMPANASNGATSKLNMHDLPVLRRIPGVTHVLPRLRGSGRITAGKFEDTVLWEGVTPELFLAFPFKWLAGRAYTQAEAENGARLAVISDSKAKELYGTTQAVGRELRIDGLSLRVVGVVDGSNSGFANASKTVAVPLTTASRRLVPPGRPQGAIDAFIVLGSSSGKLDQISEAIQRTLLAEHRIAPGRKADFSVFSLSSMMQASQESDAAMALMLAVIGAIALFIAGVGIMNVMLVALKERTREIGVARAIGASPADIRRQFIIEALALTAVGSIVGIGLGVVATWALHEVGTVAVAVNWWPAALAMAASAVTGLGAGIYPAIRASRIEVMEALRTA